MAMVADSGVVFREQLLDSGLSTLSQALEVAHSIEDNHMRTEVLADIAALQAINGNREGALVTFAQALAAAKGVAWNLAHVVVFQAKVGYPDAALQAAQNIQDATAYVRTLGNIAVAQVEAGTAESALSVPLSILIDRPVTLDSFRQPDQRLLCARLYVGATRNHVITLIDERKRR